jgi:type II secretory ATPase GspE/PulE/Tfp pilus assembly ATPase PilB-like protein
MDSLKKLFGLKNDTVLNLAAPEDIYALFRQPDIGARVKRPGDIPAETIEKMLAIEDSDLQEEDAEITQEIDSEIITLVNSILVDAYTKRASDIHFDSDHRFRSGFQSLFVRFFRFDLFDCVPG